MKKITEQQEDFLQKIKTSDLKCFQTLINEWIQNNGGYWTPLSMFASIIEEIGEIAREINHLEKVKIKKEEEKQNTLEIELGDLLFSIICLANNFEIDLSMALSKTLEKYTKRDWNRFK